MSAKLCPAGCGEVRMEHAHDSQCPYYIAWWRKARETPMSSVPDYNAVSKHADEHWRDYWNPKVGDIVMRLHPKSEERVLCTIESIIDDRISANFCHEPMVCGYIGGKDGLRPATPQEIDAAKSKFSMNGGQMALQEGALQEIHIQAAAPASATPEARHDPASRPAEKCDPTRCRICGNPIAVWFGTDNAHEDCKKAAAAVDVKAKAAVISPANGPAPAAQPAITGTVNVNGNQCDVSRGADGTIQFTPKILPDWTDGDVAQYLDDINAYCIAENCDAMASFWESNPEDKMDDRKRAYVVRAWLIGHYHYETDPRKCARIRADRHMEAACKDAKLRANRYQKTFDLSNWIHKTGSM